MYFKFILLIVCAGVVFPGYAQSVVDSAGPMLKYVDEPSGVSPKSANIKDTTKNAAPVEKTAAVPQEDSSSNSTVENKIVNIDDEDADDEDDEDNDEDKDDDTPKSDTTAGKTVKERIVDGMLVARQLMDKNSKFGEKISKSRVQGYGGAVAISPMIFALRMKPIKELIHNDKDLRNVTFPDLDKGYFPILVATIMPYGGVGNGRRIGFAGVGGRVFLESNQIDGDSAAIVSVKVSSGGFLFEKAHVRNRLNLITGGVLSWGSIEVTKDFQNGSAFKSYLSDNSDNAETAKANFLGLEMHAGGTYTVLPWMHIGVDANALFMMSVNGFGGPGNSGFVTVNPGLRLRIVLGNLG